MDVRGQDDKIEVRYAAAAVDEQHAEFEAIAEPIASTPGQAAKVTIANLQPNTSYQFRIAINGKVQPNLAGTFKTAPVEGKSCHFRLGLTSCMKLGQPQESWSLFLKERPDLHLTLGDTIYADTTDPNRQWKDHLRYRREPKFAKVLRNVPTYAMWDDHDYGPNDSDSRAEGKERSLVSWQQLWCNPGAGTSEVAGAFFKFSWGDVDFFVVDGRYHRSPDGAANDAKKRMLGDKQFAWLSKGLQESQAKFKVIASGSTLHHSSGDGWRVYTFSRHRLFDLIKKNRISGVLYLSGDIHRSLVWEHHESSRVGYPLVEVISSGIANSKTLSFAALDFNTTLDDPTVKIRIIQGNGEVSDDRTWKLSQLQVQEN